MITGDRPVRTGPEMERRMGWFSKKTPPVEVVSAGKLPKHIGIIMDGNGRWARQRGLPRQAGHVTGARVFRRIVIFLRIVG